MKRYIYLAAAAVAMAGFAVTMHIIFYEAPLQGLADFTESNPLYFNQKIFYYHVPNAFMLFAAVILCGVASLLFVRGREPRWDDVAVAAGELAVMFGAVVLVTGSIWAKVAWGSWWVWDVRLTSSLLLWMTMLGYVLVRKYGGLGSERLAAGLAIFATVNIPLVYFSVKIWRTLHPQTSVVPKLEGTQRAALWSSVLLFAIVFVLLLIARIHIARSERLVYETRERALDAGILE